MTATAIRAAIRHHSHSMSKLAYSGLAYSDNRLRGTARRLVSRTRRKLDRAIVEEQIADMEEDSYLTRQEEWDREQEEIDASVEAARLAQEEREMNAYMDALIDDMLR